MAVDVLQLPVREVVEAVHELLQGMLRVSSLMPIDLVFCLATILYAVSSLSVINCYLKCNLPLLSFCVMKMTSPAFRLSSPLV